MANRAYRDRTSPPGQGHALSSRPGRFVRGRQLQAHAPPSFLMRMVRLVPVAHPRRPRRLSESVHRLAAVECSRVLASIPFTNLLKGILYPSEASPRIGQTLHNDATIFECS